MKYLLHTTLLLILFCANLYSQEKNTTAVLEGNVNSKFQDVRPVISDDGSILYFNRRYHPENQRGEKDLQDVWKSNLSANGKFDTPKNLGEPYNDKKANDLVRASSSGDSLIFLNADYKGVSTMLALFYKNEKKAQEIKIDGYYNKNIYVDFDINFHNNVIIMAVERKDTKGDQDLYYSEYQENTKTYSTPMSMGSVINSGKADFAPFLTVDGNTLFFVSYGHKGQGGADIFMSHRLSERWDDWSEPENLGNPINSPYEETFVSIDPSLNYLYYDSYPSGAVNRDIWKATLSESIKNKIRQNAADKRMKISGVTASTEVPETSNFQISGDSTNTTAAAPIEKPIENDITETNQPIASNDNAVEALNNEVVVKDPEPTPVPPKDLNFFERIGEKLGFGESETITFYNAGKKGKKINKNVYFKFDSDKFQSKYNSLMKAIALELEANPGLKLIIEGHTDGIGGEDINKDLSCRRANNTKTVLIENGINSARIEISCEGKERPLATNDDEFEGRELNRRVEFYLF